MSIEQAEHTLLNFVYFSSHSVWCNSTHTHTHKPAFKADDMFESNSVLCSHFTKLLKSMTSGMCEIGSVNTKKKWKKKKNPQRYCNRLIYLFVLSALGHCYHDNSLMASFLPLYSLSYFTPIPLYLQYLRLMNPHPTPPASLYHTRPLLFIPNSPVMKV